MLRTLAKFMLTSIPIYSMQTLLLPEQVYNEVDRQLEDDHCL